MILNINIFNILTGTISHKKTNATCFYLRVEAKLTLGRYRIMTNNVWEGMVKG